LICRSAAQQLADAKLQHAKEMKAKASAYADAASPVKKAGSPSKSPEQHPRKSAAKSFAKASSSAAKQGAVCDAFVGVFHIPIESWSFGAKRVHT
jgi:hypothetical protein